MDPSKVKNVRQSLMDLLKQGKPGISRYELIAQNADVISDLLDARFSYDEIAKRLTDELGITFTASTLRQYHRRALAEIKAANAASAAAPSLHAPKTANPQRKPCVVGAGTARELAPSATPASEDEVSGNAASSVVQPQAPSGGPLLDMMNAGA